MVSRHELHIRQEVVTFDQPATHRKSRPAEPHALVSHRCALLDEWDRKWEQQVVQEHTNEARQAERYDHALLRPTRVRVHTHTNTPTHTLLVSRNRNAAATCTQGHTRGRLKDAAFPNTLALRARRKCSTSSPPPTLARLDRAMLPWRCRSSLFAPKSMCSGTVASGLACWSPSMSTYTGEGARAIALAWLTASHPGP